MTGEFVKRLESALFRPKTLSEDPDLSGIEERVAKRIARCGLCSRREAEKWITEGRVKIDGRIVSELGSPVRPGQLLEVDDIPIRAEPPKLFLFNKVRNMLITRRAEDEKGRNTLGQLLAEMGEPTLLPVGRLDYSSEGLLLLTNDGELKRYLEHPMSRIVRVYRVRVYGRVRQSKFDGLEKGITIDGFEYKGVKVTVESAAEREGPSPAPQRALLRSGSTVPSPDTRANTWLRVELQEGKNREIRRIMEHLGLQVSRLIRIQYGPYKLTRDIESGIVKSMHILPELKSRTNLNWNWHPNSSPSSSSFPDSQYNATHDNDGGDVEDVMWEDGPSRTDADNPPSSKLRMPKSKPPPNRGRILIKESTNSSINNTANNDRDWRAAKTGGEKPILRRAKEFIAKKKKPEIQPRTSSL